MRGTVRLDLERALRGVFAIDHVEMKLTRDEAADVVMQIERGLRDGEDPVAIWFAIDTRSGEVIRG